MNLWSETKSKVRTGKRKCLKGRQLLDAWDQGPDLDQSYEVSFLTCYQEVVRAFRHLHGEDSTWQGRESSWQEPRGGLLLPCVKITVSLCLPSLGLWLAALKRVGNCDPQAEWCSFCLPSLSSKWAMALTLSQRLPPWVSLQLQLHNMHPFQQVGRELRWFLSAILRWFPPYLQIHFPVIRLFKNTIKCAILVIFWYSDWWYDIHW